ncbi:MAG: hypothetical protein Q8M24_13365 [Pseudolabrys sp.]|nr:hypothetical protein [Pseudolabrys sp.]
MMMLRPQSIPSRKWIALLSGLACAYVLLAPTPAPSLGSIESAAPHSIDALSGLEAHAAHETQMSALRQQASLALAQLQARTASLQQ